jgi:hypothetical protein
MKIIPRPSRILFLMFMIFSIIGDRTYIHKVTDIIYYTNSRIIGFYFKVNSCGAIYCMRNLASMKHAGYKKENPGPRDQDFHYLS